MNTKRILIAGLGNIFLGDDAFGVEVVRHLAGRSLPSEVKVVDFGIRGIDLTYALLEDYQQVILVDAIQRGEPAGTLFVIEPTTTDISAGTMRTHEMAPFQALASARTMGAKLENILIVGCEPESFGTEVDPQMGLSASVWASVPAAADMVESLILETLRGCASRKFPPDEAPKVAGLASRCIGSHAPEGRKEAPAKDGSQPRSLPSPDASLGDGAGAARPALPLSSSRASSQYPWGTFKMHTLRGIHA